MVVMQIQAMRRTAHGVVRNQIVRLDVGATHGV
jgi:hypothetical protein